MSDFEPDPQLVVDALRDAQAFLGMRHLPDLESSVPGRTTCPVCTSLDAITVALPHAKALAARIEQLEADRRVPVLVGNPEVNAYARKLEAVAEAARPFVRGEAEDGDPATEPDEDWMVGVTGAELTALISALAALREDKP